MKTWEPLLYEQNAVAHLLQTPERLAHVDFETEYCINCAWAHGLQGKLPFLKRFSECSFCTGFRNSREVRSICWHAVHTCHRWHRTFCCSSALPSSAQLSATGAVRDCRVVCSKCTSAIPSW